MRAAAKAFKVDGVDVPAGSFLIARRQRDARGVKAAVESRASTRGRGERHAATWPPTRSTCRGSPIFSTWGSTQEVGWVRHAFDHFGVPFDLIYKERVRKAADLRGDYDVILIPNQGRGSAKGLVFDMRRRRRQAAGLHEDRPIPDPRRCTASRTTSPEAWASRARPS